MRRKILRPSYRPPHALGQPPPLHRLALPKISALPRPRQTRPRPRPRTGTQRPTHRLHLRLLDATMGPPPPTHPPRAALVPMAPLPPPRHRRRPPHPHRGRRRTVGRGQPSSPLPSAPLEENRRRRRSPPIGRPPGVGASRSQNFGAGHRRGEADANPRHPIRQIWGVPEAAEASPYPRLMDRPSSPSPLIVRVRRENRGRVTGWSVSCDDHGVMPVLAPAKSAALIVAGRHVEAEHGGNGQVVLARR